MSPIPGTDDNRSSQKRDEIIMRPSNKSEIKESEKELDGDDSKKYSELSDIEKELDAEIEKMKAELEAGPSVKETMERLHEYNEIKDAAQVVLGAMASMQGVTIASLHREYNLPMGEE